ncbi:MAG: hypothetical protein WCT19_00605 [Candidatus Paceibacterota bacterium]
MKRKLHPDALYIPDSALARLESKEPAIHCSVSTGTGKNMGARVRQVDPDGKKGLALLNELAFMDAVRKLTGR